MPLIFLPVQASLYHVWIILFSLTNGYRRTLDPVGERNSVNHTLREKVYEREHIFGYSNRPRCYYLFRYVHPNTNRGRVGTLHLHVWF